MFDFATTENFNLLIKYVSDNFFPLLGLILISALVLRIFLVPIWKVLKNILKSFWSWLINKKDNYRTHYRNYRNSRRFN